MPKVSIIVPNYNHAQYLKQRIDSILNQNYQDFELILMDDCSTDDSRDILLLYNDHPKVTQIIFNNQNSGNTFKQWEKGIELAQGEYIWIAESDDWAESSFLGSLVAIIGSDERVGLVYCDSVIIEESDSSVKFSDLKREWYGSLKWKENYLNEGIKEIEESLIIDCTINNASAVLLRLNFLKEVNPFDLNLKYTGDWYTYLKIASISKVAYTAKALNYYRVHKTNISKNAGYSYVAESTFLYKWMKRELNTIGDKKIIRAYHNYISNIFQVHNLSLNFRRDFKIIGKTDLQLYFGAIPLLYFKLSGLGKYRILRFVSKKLFR
jgi:glycosyltransferase involved in cell wall biosynthesis